MKTYSPKASDLRPQWHVIDAAEQPLGRLASKVAQLLKGKHKPIYSPHANTGDFVIVINSKHVKVSGGKAESKIYYRHTQYPGGLRAVPLSEMIDKHPTRVIKHAVKGMIPHNRLGRQMMKRLKLYPEDSHPHEAQVNASIKVAEKIDKEGPVWIGLPKPVMRRRPKKSRVKLPEPVAVGATEEITEETAAEEAAPKTVEEEHAVAATIPTEDVPPQKEEPASQAIEERTSTTEGPELPSQELQETTAVVAETSDEEKAAPVAEADSTPADVAEEPETVVEPSEESETTSDEGVSPPATHEESSHLPESEQSEEKPS